MQIIFFFHKFLHFERVSRLYYPGNLRSHSFSAKKRSFFGIFVRGGIEFTVFRKLGLFFSCKIHLIAFRKLSRKKTFVVALSGTLHHNLLLQKKRSDSFVRSFGFLRKSCNFTRLKFRS